MHSHRSFRSLSIILVLALLFAPWVAEARPSKAPRAESAASPSMIDHFVGWLVALWGDNGCGWDPDGRCRESLDNGCGWDPNGGCRDNG